ncbi:hypothetical protein HaLaN_06439 [Haematococcus lacustris]|uniref:Uncharacterized protein n=1 Tax=Haematococcus lacustris TaxID=44745 RepID=A0A699YVG8_HAELA|nr:hypothetical protein HaLaN_06439 [Haematococcus lacustris]
MIARRSFTKLGTLRGRTAKLAVTFEQQQPLEGGQYAEVLAHALAKLGSGLVSLLSHPQLALQLQQLDLTGTVILEPEEAGPGPAPAAALASLFQGLRLRQLSLAGPLLPHLQPLAQHLTQLRLEDCKLLSLSPLAQLQVLTVCRRLHGLHVLLQALPRLHTLQLPGMCICEQQLDALLAATQLTSIQLASIRELTSSRADLPCSWQRLELLQNIAYSTVTCLPLHGLTQPLVLGGLYVGVGAASDAEVAAAVQHLAGTCKAPVIITNLHLNACSAADVTALAPACRACTHLKFIFGSMKPSLEFWRQLVQLMPTVQQRDI